MSIVPAVFLGSKPFGLSIFRTLCAARPDVSWRVLHPDDRGDDRSALPEFEAESEATGFDLQVVASRAEAAAVLAQESYQIGFVCGWYWLLSEVEVGDKAPPLYGIHHSALPSLRGGAPVVWAMIRGDQKIESTLFRLTTGMDDGPVAGRVAYLSGSEETIGDVLSGLERLWSQSLPTFWPALVEGIAKLEPQNEAEADYCAQRRPEDGEITWSKTAAQLHNFVRAQAVPYPGAFTYVGGKKCILERTAPFHAPYCCRPGQVLLRDLAGVLIGCGNDTALWVRNVRGFDNVRDAFPVTAGRIIGRASMISEDE